MKTHKFADTFKYLRKSRGYTQVTFAKAVGLSRSTIAAYEVGTREPEYETLEMLADFFNVNMSTLLGRVEDAKLPEDMLTPMQRELFLSLIGATDDEIKMAIKVLKAVQSK